MCILREKKFRLGLVGYFLFIAIAIGYLFLCTACSPKIIKETETVVEYRDRVVHDTASVEIVKEVEKVVTRDTVSHLQNRYAKSDALVSGGFLTHSLESIPQFIKVPVEVHVTDTLIIEKEAATQIKEVKVEKTLTLWQKIRLWAFFPLLLGCCWTFQDKLIPIIKTLIKL